MRLTPEEHAPPEAARSPRVPPVADGASGRAPTSIPHAVLELQRTAGNAAVAGALAGGSRGRDVVQRVDLGQLDPATRQKLQQAYGEPIIRNLQEFHDVLTTPANCARYLDALDARVRELLEESGNKYTRALAKALAQEERKWLPAPVDGKGYETIPAEKAVVSTAELVEHLSKNRPLKDVGAAISHGEWAHRIQLWVLSRWATEGGQDPKQLYAALQVVDPADTLEKGGSPVWSWVLDIPGRVIGQPGFEPNRVGFAAPTRVTVGLTGVGPAEPGVAPLPGIQRALLNRRLKRFITARAKQAQLRAAFKTETEGAGLTEGQMKAMTTPKLDLTSERDKVEALKTVQFETWFKATDYFAWMQRQDVGLRNALERLGGHAAVDQLGGQLPATVRELGKAYAAAYEPVPDPGYAGRAAIVEAIIATGVGVPAPK